MYLGDTRESSEFARQFLERRNRQREQQRQQKEVVGITPFYWLVIHDLWPVICDLWPVMWHLTFLWPDWLWLSVPGEMQQRQQKEVVRITLFYWPVIHDLWPVMWHWPFMAWLSSLVSSWRRNRQREQQRQQKEVVGITLFYWPVMHDLSPIMWHWPFYGLTKFTHQFLERCSRQREQQRQQKEVVWIMLRIDLWYLTHDIWPLMWHWPLYGLTWSSYSYVSPEETEGRKMALSWHMTFDCWPSLSLSSACTILPATHRYNPVNVECAMTLLSSKILQNIFVHV